MVICCFFAPSLGLFDSEFVLVRMRKGNTLFLSLYCGESDGRHHQTAESVISLVDSLWRYC